LLIIAVSLRRGLLQQRGEGIANGGKQQEKTRKARGSQEGSSGCTKGFGRGGGDGKVKVRDDLGGGSEVKGGTTVKERGKTEKHAHQVKRMVLP